VTTPTGRFGLRIASWYAVVFVITSLSIVLLTYLLLAASLVARDKQIVLSTVKEYSQRYVDGGLPALADAVNIEQRTGRHERLFVRLVRGSAETLLLTPPDAWDDFDVNRLQGADGLEQLLSQTSSARLEVASAHFPDGTLLQVGKSSESREELLAEFRTNLAILSLVIVAISLAGGAIVTPSTPERLTASATNPDAFTSSMNSTRYLTASPRPLTTPTA
jgi:hypothetical protein